MSRLKNILGFKPKVALAKGQSRNKCKWSPDIKSHTAHVVGTFGVKCESIEATGKEVSKPRHKWNFILAGVFSFEIILARG